MKTEKSENKRSRIFDYRESCQDIVKNGRKIFYEIYYSRISRYEMYILIKMILAVIKVKNHPKFKNWRVPPHGKFRIESKTNETKILKFKNQKLKKPGRMMPIR